MRHVPVAEFKDKLSEVLAAAEAGEEIVVTRHGREIAKLVGIEEDRHARRRAAAEALFELGQEIRARYGPTSPEEIRAWIEEGRK